MAKKNLIKPCIIGLGYVGLPIYMALSKKFKTCGFDINKSRVKNLQRKIDNNLNNSNSITDITDLQKLSFGTNIGVCVPDYYSTKPYLYGKIRDFNQKFPVKIGIWMNLYEKTVDPILNIQINQINQHSNPLFLKYNSTTFNRQDLSFNTDNSFSLTLQREYDFSLNDISINFEIIKYDESISERLKSILNRYD